MTGRSEPIKSISFPLLLLVVVHKQALHIELLAMHRPDAGGVLRDELAELRFLGAELVVIRGVVVSTSTGRKK